MFRTQHKGSGFTLLEIIITIVIVSVLGTMIYTFFLKRFSESVTPVTRLKNSVSLHMVMANITADYNRYPRWRSGTFYDYSALAATYVIPTNFNGHYYRLTNDGTSSAPAEPVWPLTSGATVNDNGITWVESGRLRTLMPLTTLQGQIGVEGSVQSTNDYGKAPDGTYTTYTVVKNGFVQFDASGNEIDDATGGNNILKVTLQNESEETLTSLFFSD
ncbi:MAG: prepilin-type N-terminal cleavage/methylation domain-containing protein [Deltaproteobacteria bacterium]|nr:prepilin-type N-terminal cleavage/methylation domain-containing protein [Deltaproteobacteria bacterium]